MSLILPTPAVASSSPAPQLWRLHLKPKPRQGVDPRRFCFANNVAGVGWKVESDDPDLDWGQYLQLYADSYAGNRNGEIATRALRRVRLGDLIWSRDWTGGYYLGRVTSPWRYETGLEFEEADIVNVVGCEWIRVGAVDMVPGKVANAFRSARVLQRIHNPLALAYSMHVMDETRGSENASFWDPSQWPSFPESGDPFYLLSPDDCEDLVGLYLQERGWVILPSSCKPSTAMYEYILYNRETRETAAVQVKQQDTALVVEPFGEVPVDRVFLFDTGGQYRGVPSSKVTCLNPAELRSYLQDRAVDLAPKLKKWVEFSRRRTINDRSAS